MARAVNVGFGNFVVSDQIMAIVTPDSAPLRRLINEAREAKRLIDVTYGRRTRSAIVMINGMVMLSAITPETITVRMTEDELVEKSPVERKR